jgi:adenine C2-methylase RlmN of 23S rRNA A2503 and tRNA A37
MILCYNDNRITISYTLMEVIKMADARTKKEGERMTAFIYIKLKPVDKENVRAYVKKNGYDDISTFVRMTLKKEGAI